MMPSNFSGNQTSTDMTGATVGITLAGICMLFMYGASLYVSRLENKETEARIAKTLAEIKSNDQANGSSRNSSKISIV